MALRELKFPRAYQPPNSIERYSVFIRSRFIPRFLLVPSDIGGMIEIVDVEVNKVSQSVDRTHDRPRDVENGFYHDGGTPGCFYSESATRHLPEVDYDHVEAGEELAVIVRNVSGSSVPVSLVFLGDTEDARRRDER